MGPLALSWNLSCPKESCRKPVKYQPIAWALVLSCTKAPGSHVLCVASWGPSPETPPGRLCCVVYRESTRAHEVEHHRQPLPLCAAPLPREASRTVHWLIRLGDSSALYCSQVRTMGWNQGHIQSLLTEEAEGEV